MYDPARDSWEERDGDEARSCRGRLASDQPHAVFSPPEQIHGASGENNNTTDLVSKFFWFILAVDALLVESADCFPSVQFGQILREPLFIQFPMSNISSL